jgi:hypothetical protein
MMLRYLHGIEEGPHVTKASRDGISKIWGNEEQTVDEEHQL